MNQRIIKFRAWLNKEKIMANYISHLKHSPIDGVFEITVPFDESGLHTYRKLHSIDEFDLMQFTGLHDKNGKEIYEGDILKIDNFVEIDSEIDSEIEKIGVVKYSLYGQRGYCLFDNAEKTEEGCYPKHHLDSLDITMGKSDYNRHWEVVGNIYESPSLLKGQKQ